MAFSSTPSFSDDFNRADNDSLGAAWSEPVGDVDIVSNAAKSVGTGGHSIMRYEDLDLSAEDNPANYAVEFEYDFDTAPQYVYILGRWDGTTSGTEPLNCYFLYIQPLGGGSFGIYLYRRTSVAAQVLLDSDTQSLSGILKCRLEMEGTTIRGVINGTTYVSATDSTLTTQGYVGARFAQNVVLDNFAVYREQQITPQTITKSLQYAVEAPQTIQKSLQYTVQLPAQTIQKNLEYVIEAPSGAGFITRTEVTPGTTGSWQEVTAPAGVPDTASGLILHVENDSLSNQALGLRKKGSTDNRTMNQITLTHTRAFVGIDGDKKFEAYVGNASQHVYVEGYFERSHVSFFDDSIDVSPGSTGSWQDVDISSHTDDGTAIGAIFELVRAGTQYEVGLRKNGSTDDRHYDLWSHEWFMVGVDSSEILEAYIEHADVELHLIGYVRSGFHFETNGIDVTPSATSTYEDQTINEFATGALVEIVGGFNSTHVVRKNGSSDTLGASNTHYGRAYGVCEVDGSYKFESYTDDAGVGMYLLGYPTQTVSFSITKSLQYAVLTSPVLQKSLQYTLPLPAQTIQKDLEYRVNIPQTIQKELKYAVQAPQTIQKTLQYTVPLDPTTITKSLQYAMSVPQTIQKDLQYTVESSNTIQKSLRYTVVGENVNTIELSLQYAIVKEYVVQKSLQYAVLTSTTIQKSLRYEVRVPSPASAWSETTRQSSDWNEPSKAGSPSWGEPTPTTGGWAKPSVAGSGSWQEREPN